MFEISTQSLTALFTLTAMETVLGIDNIVFISILVEKLPAELQLKIRNLGISLALIIRIILLFSISWIMSLQEPLFSVFSKTFSGRDLILLGGGLFLLGKATFEIHHKVEGDPQIHLHKSEEKTVNRAGASKVLIQILLLDIVFSLDSVITAVGMANQISIMVVAMLISMLIMLISAGKISHFVSNHPTIKILALSFLLLIGVMLTAESMGAHISKGYIYFAMGFSLAVEMLNMRFRKKNKTIGTP
jgi:predicted tellurium resistance membrane protein TerC